MGFEERFGRYTLHECLGAGGMAAVHRATVDIGGGVIREVALKRLLPQLVDDKKLVDDFIREARIAAQLHHPNIVRILELGRTAGVYFIAMELVSGHSLLQLMKLAILARMQAPIGIVVALLVELCDALDYASNATDTDGEPLHIVHRDLSPSNLIVTEDGHLKIIDFGVAKAMSGKFQTSSGTVKGKFGYMSLEALQGKQLDRRADIFSVGVVAWELITGRRLFKAPNEYDVVLQIQKGASEPPSLYNRDCPPELDEIVMRALAKSREDRWTNAAVMRRTLDHVRRTYQYRESAPHVVMWIDKLAKKSQQPEEPSITYDRDPESVVMEVSEVDAPFDDSDAPMVSVSHAYSSHDHPFENSYSASAPYPPQSQLVAAAVPPVPDLEQLPEDADFSITPFVAAVPAIDGDSLLVTEHIDDSTSLVDDEPSAPHSMSSRMTAPVESQNAFVGRTSSITAERPPTSSITAAEPLVPPTPDRAPLSDRMPGSERVPISDRALYGAEGPTFPTELETPSDMFGAIETPVEPSYGAAERTVLGVIRPTFPEVITADRQRPSERPSRQHIAAYIESSPNERTIMASTFPSDAVTPMDISPPVEVATPVELQTPVDIEPPSTDLAEGSKRRNVISRPPSTLAKRSKEQRLKGDTLLDGSNTARTTAAPSTDSDIEPTTISGRPATGRRDE